MIRLIHTADVHIGRPFRFLGGVRSDGPGPDPRDISSRLVLGLSCEFFVIV